METDMPKENKGAMRIAARRLSDHPMLTFMALMMAASTVTAAFEGRKIAIPVTRAYAQSGMPALGAGRSLPYPGGTIDWAMPVPRGAVTGRIEIRDATGNNARKVVRLRDAGNGKIAATVYVAPGRGASLLIPKGRYNVTMTAGNAWLGGALQFGPSPTVTYPPIEVAEDKEKPTIIAIGATDQPFRSIDWRQF